MLYKYYSQWSIKYLITFPIFHSFFPRLNDYIILFLSIFCSFLWIKYQFIPKHFVGVGGGQFMYVQIYQTYILYLFFSFSEISPSWRSLPSCSTLDGFLDLLQSWQSWESSFIIILKIYFTFLCLVSPLTFGSHTFLSVFFLVLVEYIL